MRQDGTQTNSIHHSDVSFARSPPAVTLLHNRDGVLPPRGTGQTLFTDMRAVFDALPEPQRRELRRRRAVHVAPHVWRPVRSPSSPLR